MLEILSFDFFRNALLAGILASCISGLLGSLVVLRREPNIAHGIANILFLGIIVSFFFQGNYYVFGILSAIFGVGCIYILERYTNVSKESSKEILSQIGLAAGIFLVGFLGSMQIDVFNFLFGNILFVQVLDIYLLITMGVIGATAWFLFGKSMLRTILSPEIAKSQGIKVGLYELGYLVYLALFIAFSIKIFGILLLGAFLVLPGNIAKNISRSFYGVFYLATIISIISVIVGLFASYYFDSSAGASIVLILGLIFLLSSIIKNISKK